MPGGEQHFLPVAQLVAQPPVAAGFRRLPLQRSELLLELEDDVIEPREVQLRRLELQLRRAPARLVLRDARGFFDQLAPIGRPRAENHPDLALLDDGVRLRAQPGVHQKFMNITQTAHFTVQQVLALAGSIQAARHLDRARDRRRVVSFKRLFSQLDIGRPQYIAEPQPHLGSARGLPRIAPVEDDVFHAIAAQALRALLAQHPRDGVGHIALPAAVRSDDGGHPAIEGEMHAIGERLEAGDFELL